MPNFNKTMEVWSQLSPAILKRFKDVSERRHLELKMLESLPTSVKPLDFKYYKEKGYDKKFIESMEKMYKECMNKLSKEIKFLDIPRRERNEREKLVVSCLQDRIVRLQSIAIQHEVEKQHLLESDFKYGAVTSQRYYENMAHSNEKTDPRSALSDDSYGTVVEYKDYFEEKAQYKEIFERQDKSSQQ